MELDRMQKLIENGLSGWIVFILSILVGGGLAIRYFSYRKSRQFNVDAGGDVAGGDILKSKQGGRGTPEKSSKIDSIQTNITAVGDVAGGNIDKRTR